ncbi:MAG: 50S ribosomal protein L25 [Parcubacteria group bacterium]
MIYDLQATKRDRFGKILFNMRKVGMLPAVIYGPELKQSDPIFLKFNDFVKVFQKAGESSLINLAIDGESKPREVLVKDVAYDAVKDVPIHIDFYQIKQGQKLELDIVIEFIGEAPAVKEAGGILIKNLHNLSIRCLPKDIPEKVQVDLSSLKAIDDKIHVKDIIISETIEILQDANDVVVLVSAPVEEEAEVKPEVAAADIPTVEGEKKDEEKAESEEEGKDKKAEAKK